MPVTESEIWEASFFVGLATDHKHGALDLGDAFWAEVPEKFMSPGGPKLVPLAGLRNERGQEIVGPSAAVAVLGEAARDRGLSLAAFWRELEGGIVRPEAAGPAPSVQATESGSTHADQRENR